MELALVPLRIPTGWEVCLNKFTETFPDWFLDDTYEYCWEFDEDLLLMKNQRYMRLLDLGWYPAFHPDGCYSLKVIQLVDAPAEQPVYWEKPLLSFESREIKEIQQKIEDLLQQVSAGHL